MSLVFVISCLLGTVYVAVQQDMRIGSNDPQIQMAEDLANSLKKGQKVTLPANTIDIAQSLSPFVMIFDSNGKVVSTSGFLHNTFPVVPPSVFTSTMNSGEERFTWQPEIGVRIAAVVTKYSSGFILAGRNIREIEKREDQLYLQILFGWIATVVVSFFATLLFWKKK